MVRCCHNIIQGEDGFVLPPLVCAAMAAEKAYTERLSICCAQASIQNTLPA